MVDIDDEEKEQIFRVIQNGKIRKLTNFISQASDIDMDFTDDSGKTPLICAVCYDEMDDIRTHMVRTLLRHGCNVNKQDVFGCTALMYSCMDCNREDATRLLTKKGNCDPNIQDNESNTALMHAVLASNAAALQILVTSSSTRSKSNLDLRNNEGLTVLEMAIKLKMGQCCKVLVHDGCADTRYTKDLKGLRILLGTEVDSHGKEHAFMHKDNQLLSTSTPRRNSTSAKARTTSSMQRCSSPTPDVILQNASNDFTDYSQLNASASYSSTNRTHQTYDVSWATSPRRVRRALTPLLRDNARISDAAEDVFSHRTRLPSIPTGKRMCMVNSSNISNTQSDHFNV